MKRRLLAPDHLPRGAELLNNPLLNKGTAFTNEERTLFGLHGLLPPDVETLDEQVARAYRAYLRKDEDLERNIYLRQLQDNNEVLFYRLLLDHIVEMLPIVYTPVVALACQYFSHSYRRPRGLFISYPLREFMAKMLQSRPSRDVDVIVVTDGERILGIGDQGVGGLAIPIGKLALYTLIGGIHPSRTLPIVLDVGTNNPDGLGDPEYLGWRHPRVTGQDYADFIEQFVREIQREMPAALVQWEDFSTEHARPILEAYRDQLLTFNDDIQGTAAVVLGAVLGAVRVTGMDLRDQQVVMLGAGSAGIGVADYLRRAMVAGGLTESEARNRFWIVDKGGLLHAGRRDLSPAQRLYAQDEERIAGWPATSEGKVGLADVIGQIDATILIGLSTAYGAFTEAMVKEMARKTRRPIILPISNPTSRAEASAQDLIQWTQGRALIATGSPSAPVSFEGRTISVAQCNNVYVFPAVGLGVVAARARRVTDGMMLAAARALGESSPALENPAAPLLPALTNLRQVTAMIAQAVGEQARKEGVAEEMTVDALRGRVRASQWTPSYSSMIPRR